MSRKILIILVVNFVVTVGLIGTGFYLISKKVSSPDGEKKAVPKTETKAQQHPTMIGPIYPLEAFIVNLADTDGKRFLRVTIDLELSEEPVTEEIKERLPQIRDSILTILPTKKLEDLQSVQGKTALREEIITTVNSFLSQGHITNIYFTEFVFQ